MSNLCFSNLQIPRITIFLLQEQCQVIEEQRRRLDDIEDRL